MIEVRQEIIKYAYVNQVLIKVSMKEDLKNRGGRMTILKGNDCYLWIIFRNVTKRSQNIIYSLQIQFINITIICLIMRLIH